MTSVPFIHARTDLVPADPKLFTKIIVGLDFNTVLFFLHSFIFFKKIRASPLFERAPLLHRVFF